MHKKSLKSTAKNFKKLTFKEQTEHVFEYYHYADYDDTTGKIINIKHKEKNPDYFITIPIDHIELTK